jgi:hypothetical protein
MELVKRDFATSILARIFHENALASASPVACCGVGERTTIKWSKYLTFRRFPAACCRELQLLWRDREDGRATGKPQGIGPEAYLSGTSQGPIPEDARKEGHIRGRSKLFMKYPGWVFTFL